MPEEHQKIVLLNTMISRSVTRARNVDAPVEPALELFKILEKRRTNKVAIEFYGSTDHDDDEKRIRAGEGHDLIRLKMVRFEQHGDFNYTTLLLEFIDEKARAFAVVDRTTFAGRDLHGKDNERGAWTCHVVVRTPVDGKYDDGKYRCAIEQVHEITRRDIEQFLAKQLRRHAHDEEWSFPVESQKAGQKPFTKHYLFAPRLDLAADVGRKLNFNGGGEARELSLMVFTKRRERVKTAQATQVHHEDFLADLEYRVSASQGPADPADKRTWAEGIREYFQHRGFDTKLYFRHVNGSTISGAVHKAVAGAADLLMCPRDHISLSRAPRACAATINGEIVEEMRKLLDKDSLWEHSR